MQRDLALGRDLVLGADVADRVDQFAHALKLPLGGLVNKRGVESWPARCAENVAGCGRQRHARDRAGGQLDELLEDRLGDEGNHGMQQTQDRVQCRPQHGLLLGA